jgi:hypothetical protein
MNRRRLSSAIGPKQAEYFPFFNLDADIVDGANGLVVDLREIVRFNDVRHFGFPSCSAGFNSNRLSACESRSARIPKLHGHQSTGQSLAPLRLFWP